MQEAQKRLWKRTSHFLDQKYLCILRTGACLDQGNPHNSDMDEEAECFEHRKNSYKVMCSLLSHVFIAVYS